ncbi:MAG TPA: OpgC domain-containing protein, partial [Reyranella sp.]|nr:OpgC domain-containing protein [Reyranella sp.]
MGRLTILDGLRGYFLVFMFLNHLAFTGGYMLVKINHDELGFVEGVQGFVFLSGLLAGLVHGQR